MWIREGSAAPIHIILGVTKTELGGLLIIESLQWGEERVSSPHSRHSSSISINKSIEALARWDISLEAMEVSRAYYKPLSDSAGGEEMVSVRGINPRVIT